MQRRTGGKRWPVSPLTRRILAVNVLALALLAGGFLYLGKYQARWYRTMRGVGGTGEDADPQTQWVETEVTRMHPKSVIARVRKKGGACSIVGFVLNDGTPLKSVEVRVDDGPWHRATLDPQNTEYSWKLFSYSWDGLGAGDHTIVSRAVDANGVMQPEV